MNGYTKYLLPKDFDTAPFLNVYSKNPGKGSIWTCKDNMHSFVVILPNFPESNVTILLAHSDGRTIGGNFVGWPIGYWYERAIPIQVYTKLYLDEKSNNLIRRKTRLRFL